MTMLDFVKEKWNLLTAFSKKEEVKAQLWEEILYAYSAPHRFYHTISHLAHMFSLCDEHIQNIRHPAIMGFAIIYHDFVYDTYRDDNEELSAAIASTHLTRLSVNPSLIKNVQAYIRATKDHSLPAGFTFSDDVALFIDLDMAILGAEPPLYEQYSRNIRQEYAKFPDDLYKEGRKLALRKVLASDHLFATSLFRETMEAKARENINNELRLL